MTHVRDTGPLFTPRIQRRGAFLLLFGLSYFAVSYSQHYPEYRHPPVFLHDLIDVRASILLWALAGAAACVTAFMRRPGHDMIGFVALCIPVAWRSISYLIGITEFGLVGNEFKSAVAGFVVYLSMLIAIMVVSSWPDPRPVLEMPRV